MEIKKAVPVWAKGESEKLNSQIVLKQSLSSLENCTLKVGASYFYKVWVNQKFVGFGPARTASGYARIDEFDLTVYSKTGKNEIVIECAGYHCRSLSTCFSCNFVVAEVESKGEVLFYTGRDFSAISHPYRLCKTERYSMQRHFSEVYDKRRNGGVELQLEPLDIDIEYLDRIAPYPTYDTIKVESASKVGKFDFDAKLPVREKRYSGAITPRWGTYLDDEIEYKPYRWVQSQRLTTTAQNLNMPLDLNGGEYAVIDYERIQVGFITWQILAKEESDIVFAFSEMIVSQKDFEFQNANMHNAFELLLGENSNENSETFEPYSLRYLIIFVKSGKITLGGIGVKKFERPSAGIRKIDIEDTTLQKVYDAGVRTFLHNAVDIYSDCPSRERAGWLCDSFFSGKVEYFLFGNSQVEQAFLQNYQLYKPDGVLPKGALPMCYPADIGDDGKFIPQWNMWLVLEIFEYLTERNEKADKNEFKAWIYEFLGFLEKYENESGLLEKLPSWNFVEWSTANEWTWDVNYPTNFLYARVLECVGLLYGDSVLIKKANSVRKNTLSSSFDGRVFVDHAVRNEQGILQNLTDTSEACQYYAVLFGNVDLQEKKYGYIKNCIKNGFDEIATTRNFVPVNAFIGFYLRILMLIEKGEKEILKKDVIDFFSPMIRLTDTLWEYKQHKGSYDHGFASFAIVACAFLEDKLK